MQHNPRPLCAALHCAIRNRHRDTCPDQSQCWGCLPRWAADGLMLCDVDVRRITEDAAKAADLHLGLESAIIRSGTGGEKEKTSGTSSGAPVPDDEVVATRSRIRGTLLAIVRLITEQRGVTPPSGQLDEAEPPRRRDPAALAPHRPEDLRVAAVFIAKHAEWIAAHRYGPAIARDLRNIAGDGKIWALAYPAGSDRLYVGDCPMPVTEPDDTEGICGARLYQYPEQPLITCTGCRREETIEQWRRWLVGEANGEASAYHIASLLAVTWMRPVGPDTVKRWGQRGHIEAVTEPVEGTDQVRVKRDEKNRTQYPVTQVVEYATELWGPPATQRRAS